MKAFIVHTRAVPGCCKVGDAPTVVEVEGERITAIEDPSVMWMSPGEFKFRITKPEFLYESHEMKLADGSKKKHMVPSVYCSHAIYWLAKDARLAAEEMVKSSLEFEVRKGRIASYTDEELQAKFAEIQEVLLP